MISIAEKALEDFLENAAKSEPQTTEITRNKIPSTEFCPSVLPVLTAIYKTPTMPIPKNTLTKVVVFSFKMPYQ